MSTASVLVMNPEPVERTDYVALVAHPESLNGVEIHFFSWRRFILGRFDVLHFHWPERLWRGSRSKWRTWGKMTLFAMALLRCLLSGSRVLRTVHNERPHEALDRLERVLYWLLDTTTHHWIYLNGCGYHRTPSSIFLHPRYPSPISDCARTYGHPRVGFFGHIRRYKGLDTLLKAHSDMVDNSEFDLLIAGKPFGDRELLQEQLSNLPHVLCDLRYLNDHELRSYVRSCSLVVLPYEDFYNSGVALLALSCNVPILVPRTCSSSELRAEVGVQWVLQFDAPLAAEDLASAWNAVGGGVFGEPDLSNRDAAVISAKHAALYRELAK